MEEGTGERRSCRRRKKKTRERDRATERNGSVDNYENLHTETL